MLVSLAFSQSNPKVPGCCRSSSTKTAIAASYGCCGNCRRHLGRRGCSYPLLSKGVNLATCPFKTWEPLCWATWSVMEDKNWWWRPPQVPHPALQFHPPHPLLPIPAVPVSPYGTFTTLASMVRAYLLTRLKRIRPRSVYRHRKCKKEKASFVKMASLFFILYNDFDSLVSMLNLLTLRQVLLNSSDAFFSLHLIVSLPCECIFAVSLTKTRMIKKIYKGIRRSPET